MKRILSIVANWAGFALLFLCASFSVQGQDWHEYQITDYPYPGQVRQVGAVADSLGYIHIYAIHMLGDGFPEGSQMFYLRLNTLGETLTDTVRLDPLEGDGYATYSVVLCNESGDNFCVWSDRFNDGSNIRPGMFFTMRNSAGEEVMPMRLVGLDFSGSGPPDREFGGVYRNSDSTIHLIGNPENPYRYYKLSSAGDTLVWRRSIQEMVIGENVSVALDPRGRLWGAIRNDFGSGEREVIFVRLDGDTSQVTFRPIGPDGSHLTNITDLHIDSEGNFHCILGSNHEELDWFYCLYDSNFNIVEWRDLGVFSIAVNLTLDSHDNCHIVWNDTDVGPSWYALRDSEGLWERWRDTISTNGRLKDIQLMIVQDSNLAFCCLKRPSGSDVLQLFLYSTAPMSNTTRPWVDQQLDQLFCYPNPFNGAPSVVLPPAANGSRLVVYDILGRQVASVQTSPLSLGERIRFDGLNRLTSGTFFLTVEGHDNIAPLRIVKLK